jgi:glycosyltransferase involved in cell wall biosynthesis
LGVDTETFKPDFEARKRFREKHGWDDNTFVVGLVGVNYTTDRKNIINLIRAFQYFHKKHPIPFFICIQIFLVLQVKDNL